ncbi:MAG: hypothetical protein NTZ83_03190, partial [Candidatus Pacearchaeota archaeon]|nr:hypothetical protein [Candidatus Pacearchaeota archaeon]
LEENAYKGKIIVTDFEINPIKKYFNKRSLRGVNVGGLIKIIINNDNDNTDLPEEYIITFKKGKMKMIDKDFNNSSEIEKPEIEDALRKHYNGISRDCIKRKREGIYNKQVETYFPREELEKKLDSIVEYKTNNIPAGALKRLINEILNEKGVPIQEQKSINYDSRVWRETFNKFMLERGYTKKRSEYVKPQE